ncbi:TPA: hypothetical protein ACWL71_002024 [Pseudomonas aeruginosa]
MAQLTRRPAGSRASPNTSPENGVEPDTWYQLNAEGEFVEFDE